MLNRKCGLSDCPCVLSSQVDIILKDMYIIIISRYPVEAICFFIFARKRFQRVVATLNEKYGFVHIQSKLFQMYLRKQILVTLASLNP